MQRTVLFKEQLCRILISITFSLPLISSQREETFLLTYKYSITAYKITEDSLA